MKKVLVLAVCIFAVFSLSGCDKEKRVYEDQRMGDANKRSNVIEYNIYVKNIVDSGYNWYSTYVNSFLDSIKDNGYKTDKRALDDQLEKVGIKLKEVEKINPSKVEKAYGYIEKDLTKKDKEDSKFKEDIKLSKDRIKENKKYMEKILSDIKTALDYGADGSYSKEELQKISDIQTEIIKIYDLDLKGKY